jgi:helix-turn-helix protein
MQSELEINIKTAIIWQLQHLVKNLTNTKFLNAAQTETEKVSDFRQNIILYNIEYFRSLKNLTGKITENTLSKFY